MKRICSVIVLIAFLMLGCSIVSLADDSVRVAGLKGPTSMGLVKMMHDDAGNAYSFSIAGSADEITPKLVRGELDIAAVPANLASVLYNNTDGQIRLIAINTLGVLYIVEKGDSVQQIQDLRGKTIYATGKGSTPEYALRFILSQNGIDPERDVTIEFKSEPTEVVAALAAMDAGITMLPQPYTTVAQGSVEGLHIVLDLTHEWEALDQGGTLVTGVLVARTAFINEHPEQVAAFMQQYEDSVKWVLENTDEAAELIDSFGIVKANVAKKALPYCNITFISGAEMIRPMEGYLQSLLEQNPKSIGGKLPDAEFYYAG